MQKNQFVGQICAPILPAVFRLLILEKSQTIICIIARVTVKQNVLFGNNVDIWSRKSVGQSSCFWKLYLAIVLKLNPWRSLKVQVLCLFYHQWLTEWEWTKNIFKYESFEFERFLCFVELRHFPTAVFLVLLKLDRG